VACNLKGWHVVNSCGLQRNNPFLFYLPSLLAEVTLLAALHTHTALWSLGVIITTSTRHPDCGHGWTNKPPLWQIYGADMDNKIPAQFSWSRS